MKTLEVFLGIGLLFINLLTFLTLYFKKMPKVRWFLWLFFYSVMAVLSYLWLDIFFPGFMDFTDPLGSVYPWLVILAMVETAYSIWFLFRFEGKKSASVAGVMLVIGIICVLLFTSIAVNIRLEAGI